MATPLSMTEVIKRNTNLTRPVYISVSSGVNARKVYATMNENSSVKGLISSLECFDSFSDNIDQSAIMALDVFNVICTKGSVNDIRKASNIIKENVLQKVRDASQTQSLIKRRLSYIRTKISTKINNKIDDLNNAVSAALPQSISPTIKTEQVIEEELQQMFDITENLLYCDRIINNHNMISKRYNIDLIVKEGVVKGTIDDCILELCSLIDTYNIPDKAKYYVALENILYVFRKNKVNVSNNIIVENVTDYFLMNNLDIKDVKSVLENSRFFTREDSKNILDYCVETPEVPIINEKYYFNEVDLLVEASKLNPIKKLIFNFKASKDKSVSALKDLVKSIFMHKTPNDVIHETDNIFSIIFSFFILSLSISILGPIFGIITFMTEYFISMHLERKQFKRVIDVYKRNIEKAEKKLATLKTKESKKKCEAYISHLKKDLVKLEDYYETLLDEDEKENKEDFGFGEGLNNISEIENTILICESIPILQKWDEKNILFMIENNIDVLKIDDIDSITEFSISYPMLNSKELLLIYENHLSELRSKSSPRNYIRIDALLENIHLLKSKPVEEFKESSLNDIYNMIIYTTTITESLYEYNNYISLNEMNFTNTIKLTIERLKKVAGNLSDKEKVMSKTIDSSLETLQRNMEKALMQDNREAVIKNNILPSTSKIIKLAITSGLAWIISPALSIIVLLGSFAMNARIRRKERQLIVDELEVELDMIDKYIRIAEDKNNMKELKNLLLIKKKLQAQEAKIKYKIKVETDQPIRSNPIERD